MSYPPLLFQESQQVLVWIKCNSKYSSSFYLKKFICSYNFVTQMLPKKKKRQIALEFMSYKSLFLLCTPERIRTSNRLIRSQFICRFHTVSESLKMCYKIL